MLLWVQQELDYKPGYVAANFKDRYGRWPRGLMALAKPPDAMFLNWLKSKSIDFHKRRQKEAAHAA